MPFVPVPKTIACDVIAELFGQVIENTLYFAFPDEPLISEVAQLSSSVAEWAVGALCPVLSEDYIYKRTEARGIWDQAQPAITNVVGTNTPGAVASPGAPGGTCIAVSFRTAYGGRSYRGRNFVSGFPLNACEGNQLATAYASGIVEAYEALVPDYVADDLPNAVHVVASRFSLGAPRVTGITTPINAYLMVNRDLDSQRRRLTGRGN